MPELMTQPVVEALSGRVRIQNGKQYLHRRGWFLAGEVLLDGQHVVSYTEHGDGSAADIEYQPGGEDALRRFFDEIPLSEAMKKGNWWDEEDILFDLKVGTVFECQFVQQY